MVFPIVSVEDSAGWSCQLTLLEHLGIGKLYGCIGSSLGGMQSIMAGALYPERVGR